MPGRQVAVQHDLHTEGCEVDVPRFNERIEKRHAVFGGDVEDIRLQELEHDDSHVFITAVGESSDEAELLFVVQFFLRESLDYILVLLGVEAFERTEWLLFEHRANRLSLTAFVFDWNQL